MTDERLEELEWAWNLCDTWSDEDYLEWWDGLTDKERALINIWDEKWERGFFKIVDELNRMC